MSVHQRPSGRYQVKWRDGDRQRSRTFDRKRDAVWFDRDRRAAAQRAAGVEEIANTAWVRRMVDALWFYADPANDDNGDRARAALAAADPNRSLPRCIGGTS